MLYHRMLLCTQRFTKQHFFYYLFFFFDISLIVQQVDKEAIQVMRLAPQLALATK